MPDRKRVVEHLRSCERCFEIYQDTAISRGLYLSGASVFESTPELIDAGKRLVSHDPSREAAHKAEESSRASMWSKNRVRFATVAACVIVVIAASLWLIGIDREEPSDVISPLLGPVRFAVETASRWGPIVLPGGERSLDVKGSIYRSGYVPLSDSLKSSLKFLYQAYRQGRSSPGMTYWLMAGYVATGQIDAARDVASDARRQYPRDSRIATLEGIIAYIDGDYDRSETILRGVIDRNPDNPLASINLGIVLAKSGSDAEAREILTGVLSHYSGTPLAKRAQAILDDLKE